MAICQSCQRATATRRVTLMQNIGFVIARTSKTFTGELCRDCGLRMAKEYTLITAFLGWWGIISFVLTPIFLIGNIVSWSQLSKLPPSDAPWSPSQPGELGQLGQFGVAGGGQFAPPASAPAASKGRADSSGTVSLVFAVLGIFFICIPVFPAISIFFAIKAKKQSDEDGTAFPKTAMGSLVLSALSLLCFAAFGALLAWSSHEKSAKLQAVRTRADQARTVAALDKASACTLVEELLLEDDFEGKTVQTVSCGELTGTAERMELSNVNVVFTSAGSTTLTACLRKGDRWFAAGLDACVDAPLAAKTPGLNADDQEDRWRAAEKTAASEARVAKLQRTLDALLAVIEEAEDVPLKDCSSDTAIGRKIPQRLAELADGPYRSVASDETQTVASVDLEALLGTVEDDWKFMSSKTVLKLLDKKADASSRGDAARELLAHRYLVITDGAIARELPGVPATTPGVRFDGGAFIGLMYLADLQSGELLCTAPFEFESSETIEVTTVGGKSSDDTVKVESKKDFAKQYAKAMETTLSKVLRQAPLTAEAGDEVDDARPPKAAAKKPPPPAKKKGR